MHSYKQHMAAIPDLGSNMTQLDSRRQVHSGEVHGLNKSSSDWPYIEVPLEICGEIESQ